MKVKADWNILTVTRGGTVSLLKNLTEDVARRTMQSLASMSTPPTRDPWGEISILGRVEEKMRSVLRPDPRRNRVISGGFYHVSNGDIVRAECFGPEGRELDVWPKPADYDDRLAAAMAEAMADTERWEATFAREDAEMARARRA